MKLLLLTLVLGLAYAKQNSKISGEWRTQYIASTNTSMTEEGGPLRVYIREFTCDSECETVNVSFYVKTPECQPASVVGTLTSDEIYTTDFSGQNYFQFLHVSKDFMVIYIKNVNGDSVTEIMEAFDICPQ
ncbi:male-specific submandibular salivary gland protein-like isoform X1 [Talpa occidentalis]|uniref:male-specific submandibular salivary gland protein-like isoform X1 n=1 Tax=Talpa occidentalis TaxID=50954 RepID=UPI001890ACF8|nr:male-specific submandibular salivary gland protein-like isoform X1 [Talpa occidentalis]